MSQRSGRPSQAFLISAFLLCSGVSQLLGCFGFDAKLSFCTFTRIPALRASQAALPVPSVENSARPLKEETHFSSLVAAGFVLTSVSGLIASSLGARRLNRSSSAQQKRVKNFSAVPCRAFENDLGAIPPLGFFDPLGLSKDGDFAEFYRRREAELKNGRVAMYATLGYIVPEVYKFPGFLSPTEDIAFEDVPNGINALGKVPPEGWLQIIAWCGWFEWVINQPKHPSEPGNYYRGRCAAFPKTKISDLKVRLEELNKELSHSRLAMIAIAAMMVQDGVNGGTGLSMWAGPLAPFFKVPEIPMPELKYPLLA
eukprot:TRINITY_DN11754_c0_g1_i1.p1 TRINITY_DN11754_c0_g1~~TRINITY_DN11754_c0_g1_i1.p1  ORF type:complete len:312 (-),score=46.76 TRINITY_DN11754_c0_g1_i1:281-1216(-)